MCKSILKCGFPTKGIELTRFILFEVLRVLQNRNFSVLDKLVRFCICYQERVFPLPWWYFPVRMKTLAFGKACTVLLWEEMIIFSWCSYGLPLIERNLKKWILSTKSSCIKRQAKMALIWGLWCSTKDIPEDTCS